ncbi:MAG: hypothetical protein ACKVIQ_02450, partial [Acidimicrobiales bacterium]
PMANEQPVRRRYVRTIQHCRHSSPGDFPPCRSFTRIARGDGRTRSGSPAYGPGNVSVMTRTFPAVAGLADLLANNILGEASD